MVFVVALLYEIALYFNQPYEFNPKALNKLPLVMGAILSVLFITNDLHHLAFTKKNGILNGDTHGYGVIFLESCIRVDAISSNTSYERLLGVVKRVLR